MCVCVYIYVCVSMSDTARTQSHTVTHNAPDTTDPSPSPSYTHTNIIYTHTHIYTHNAPDTADPPPSSIASTAPSGPSSSSLDMAAMRSPSICPACCCYPIGMDGWMGLLLVACCCCPFSTNWDGVVAAACLLVRWGVDGWSVGGISVRQPTDPHRPTRTPSIDAHTPRASKQAWGDGWTVRAKQCQGTHTGIHRAAQASLIARRRLLHLLACLITSIDRTRPPSGRRSRPINRPVDACV